MDPRFVQKTAKVLVVEAASSARQLLTDGFHALGFESVQSVASVKAALSLLEVEQPDWVVTSLGASEPVNALHILKICTLHPALRHVRMSLFLDESERVVLPRAFELGLLSWHSKPITKETLEHDLRGLTQRLEAQEGNTCLVAASQLRDLLLAAQQVSSLLELCEQLGKVFAGNLELLLWLAEAKFLGGQTGPATSMLRQLKMVAPAMAPAVDALLQQLHGGAPPEAEDGGSNLLNLHNCLILDTDTQAQMVSREVLNSFGAAGISVLEDGESAWEQLKDAPEPDLILCEWRLPKLATPFLVQRLRQRGFHKVPILVVSSLLRHQDHVLARELGVSTVVPKPCNREKLLAALLHTLQQAQQPTELSALEAKIRQHLALKQIREATALRDIYLADPNASAGQKSEIAAEFAYVAAEYPLARDLAMEALRQNGDSLRVLGLLGKTLMQLRDFATAVKCLEKADSLAPHNIERLCSLAEAHSELGDHEAADANLESADRLDAESARLAQAKVRVALTTGDTERARSLLGTMEAPETIVAFLNNRAVALARCGQIEDGLKAYDQALEAIPDELADLRAVVNYNLALALCRDGRLSDAKLYLSEALKNKSRVFAKAHNLLDRVEAALLRGLALKFSTANAVEPGPRPAASGQTNGSDLEPLPEPEIMRAGSLDAPIQSDTMAMLSIARGTMCCHLLYKASPPAQQLADSLLQKLPRFVLRRAIERDEALGVDRLREDAG